jgi:L-fuconolactonase
VIDSHFHSWRLGANDCTWPTAAEGPIHRDVLPFHWASVAMGAGVSSGVLVQSQESERDTAWLTEMASAHHFIGGVVGWADLTQHREVERLAANPWVRGLRPMAQGKPADWFDDLALDKGLKALTEAGLAFDALVRPRHLAALERMARRHPKLRIVIDHGAKPDIARGGSLMSWKADMAWIAALPNVHCKLSGLLTEARPGQEVEVASVAAWLLDTFGPDRLIWGSDWPVVELAGTYQGWLRLAKSAIPEEARERVFGENARGFYRLG